MDARYNLFLVTAMFVSIESPLQDLDKLQPVSLGDITKAVIEIRRNACGEGYGSVGSSKRASISAGSRLLDRCGRQWQWC